MSIEVVPLAQRGADVQQSAGRSRPDGLDSDKEPGEFLSVLNRLDKEPAPSAVEAASDAADVDPAAKGDGRKKSPSAGKPATAATPDSMAWMAAHLPPMPTPPEQTAADAVDGAVPMAVGAVASGVAGLQASVTDSQAHSANLANYASVFEQIQSRMATGGVSAADSGLQAGEAPGLGKAALGKSMQAAAADIRADRLANLADGGRWVLPVTEVSAVQTALDAAASLASTASEKQEAVSLKGEHAPEGGVGHHAFTPTVHFESAAAPVDAAPMTPEAAIADQVSYWISQGIQNAELTLDGAGGQPVEVSISLSGKEAHVEFRTDQLETRDFLTGAASHLKDMLQREGMVLSGLSVGSSGAGGAGARERRAPTEEHPHTARRAAAEIAVRPVASPRASGRALDLFV